jgi:7,8-dihydroneopterin aldolase/epimerase/oxygenase
MAAGGRTHRSEQFIDVTGAGTDEGALAEEAAAGDGNRTPTTGEPGLRDSVTIRGLRARGRHGWFAFEQEEGQTFVVDVELFTDTTVAAASDDFYDAVDYGAVIPAVLAVVEGEPLALIETLAQRIADACLADPRVGRVAVTVHKPEAPVVAVFDDIAVSIVRDRE